MSSLDSRVPRTQHCEVGVVVLGEMGTTFTHRSALALLEVWNAGVATSPHEAGATL